MNKASKRRQFWFKSFMIVLTGLVLLGIIIVMLPKDQFVNDPMHVEWMRYNDSIFLSNKTFASKNPYGFTDSPRQLEKDSGVYRIAVLGDSYIWGDGLPYDSVWSHKLEDMLLAEYTDIEIMHWGQNGWSTKTQMTFFDTAGRQYQPDLLIIGYVDNDPDLGNYKQLDPGLRGKLWLLYKIAPGTVEGILSEAYTRSYFEWMDKLHTPENLQKYAALWRGFLDTLDKDETDVLIVQTPSCLYEPDCTKYYEAVKPYFDSLGLEYVDLFPEAKEKYGHMDGRELRASPVNGHPGNLLTTNFAQQVYSYLHETGRLPIKQELPDSTQ